MFNNQEIQKVDFINFVNLVNPVKINLIRIWLNIYFVQIIYNFLEVC